MWMTQEKFEKLDRVTVTAIKEGRKLILKAGQRYETREAAVVPNPLGDDVIVIFHSEEEISTSTEKRINGYCYRIAPKEPERRTVYLNLYDQGFEFSNKARVAHGYDSKASANGMATAACLGVAIKVNLIKHDGGTWQVDKEA